MIEIDFICTICSFRTTSASGSANHESQSAHPMEERWLP